MHRQITDDDPDDPNANVEFIDIDDDDDVTYISEVRIIQTGRQITHVVSNEMKMDVNEMNMDVENNEYNDDVICLDDLRVVEDQNVTVLDNQMSEQALEDTKVDLGLPFENTMQVPIDMNVSSRDDEVGDPVGVCNEQLKPVHYDSTPDYSPTSPTF